MQAFTSLQKLLHYRNRPLKEFFLPWKTLVSFTAQLEITDTELALKFSVSHVTWTNGTVSWKPPNRF